MTQTMLERAAVALMNRQRNRYGLCSINAGMFDPEELESAKDLARAVLMAVREPDDATGGMVDQGYETMRHREVTTHKDARVCFTAMIDAILNEGEPK